MEELKESQTLVLNVLDEQIEKLERKLKKVQPLINELNQLRATRRVLLSEKGTTGGGGAAARAKLTQEEVIHFMREADGPVKPAEIAQHFSVDGTVVRSHLNRHKDTTYSLNGEGWSLIGADEEE